VAKPGPDKGCTARSGKPLCIAIKPAVIVTKAPSRAGLARSHPPRHGSVDGKLEPRGGCPGRRLEDGGSAQAIGSDLISGRVSHVFPAATMQLRPAGVVLTTVQVPFSSEA
jgi:hypothetical protein